MGQSVAQMLSKSFSETENRSFTTLCCCITDTSVFRQPTESIWKPWLRFRLADQGPADTWKGRLLCAWVVLGCHSCAASHCSSVEQPPNSQQPPACSHRDMECQSYSCLHDGWMRYFCPDNPLQSPFPCSPGCCFIFSSMKGDQIENVNVVLGKERWWMGRVAEG